MKCKHCKLEISQNSAVFDKNGFEFCCNGCKQVFAILNSNHIADEFYEKLGKNELSPASQKQNLSNIDSFYKNFVTKNSEGFNEINIVIENIHCTACIWLNEKIVSKLPGVVEIFINSTNNKAKIVWDENLTSLKDIFDSINSIGYKAIPYDASRSESRMANLRREFYAKLLVGIFCSMNIMWIAIALYGGYFSGISSDFKAILTFGEFILASPALFYTGSEFFRGGYYAIKNRTPNMDLLVVTGASLTYLYSVYAMLTKNGEVYFESVAMIITFVFVGKYLETLSKKHATDTLDSMTSQILSNVRLINLREIDPNSVKIGDVFLITNGEKVLIDGEIIEGEASFDLSSLTGESLPQNFKKGDLITSGAVCLDGFIKVKATQIFKNSTLNKIINLLENSTAKKPKIEILANQISSYFSIVILSIAFFTFIFWFLNTNFEKALIVAISVLVIACPCALGLATPVASLVGISKSLKNSIIFKNSKTLETLAKAKYMVFDKTGTLTNGKLNVVNFKTFDGFDENLLMNLLKSSTHPISVSVYDFLKNRFKYADLSLQNFKNFPAKGIIAEFDGIFIKGGSKKFLQEDFLQNSEVLQNLQNTNYIFSQNNKITAIFELKDEIRENAKTCVQNLKNLGFEIYLLSGDNQKAVQNVADLLNIKNYKAEILPNEKAEFIQNLGKNSVMVGDGVNDVAAISLAGVGICLGSGAGVSIDKSDVVLLKDDLISLQKAVFVSKLTYKTIKQNIFLSIFYNAITVPLAVCGFIIPLFAAISMSFSSIIVILNSLRIKGKK